MQALAFFVNDVIETQSWMETIQFCCLRPRGRSGLKLSLGTDNILSVTGLPSVRMETAYIEIFKSALALRLQTCLSKRTASLKNTGTLFNLTGCRHVLCVMLS